MGTLFWRIGDKDFLVNKSSCGNLITPIAVIERPSGQIDIFFHDAGSNSTLYRTRTRDKGVTGTVITYTIKDETNTTISSSSTLVPICSLILVASISTYFLCYFYDSKILMTKGTLDTSDAITWAQPTIVVSNVTMHRPQIIYNMDGSLDVYYKVYNIGFDEIIKIKRSKDYGITWTDVDYNPSTEVKKENIRIFNLPEISKVGIVSHDGNVMNHDYLTHTADGKLTLTENVGNTNIVPIQTPAVLRSRADEYYIAYQSGIGLTLNFARSRDAGLTWSKV